MGCPADENGLPVLPKKKGNRVKGKRKTRGMLEEKQRGPTTFAGQLEEVWACRPAHHSS